MKHDWTFVAYDNGGGHQVIRVKASSKTEAIEKGMTKAKIKAKGDIFKWDCRLNIRV
jgi:hypothetical protein